MSPCDFGNYVAGFLVGSGMWAIGIGAWQRNEFIALGVVCVIFGSLLMWGSNSD